MDMMHDDTTADFMKERSLDVASASNDEIWGPRTRKGRRMWRQKRRKRWTMQVQVCLHVPLACYACPGVSVEDKNG